MKPHPDFPLHLCPQAPTCRQHTKGGGSCREVTEPHWVIPSPVLCAFVPLTLPEHLLVPGTGWDTRGGNGVQSLPAPNPGARSQVGRMTQVQAKCIAGTQPRPRAS